MPKQITERGPVGLTTEAATDPTKAGRLQVALITPGWGSSGYYSAQVLENAANAQVFPAGTQIPPRPRTTAAAPRSGETPTPTASRRTTSRGGPRTRTASGR
ncbi:MAG: hypothetical protein L0I24_10120 [Pseudonocardia sp.]|nr:hypothetical protein [Pseudonocardia sp.]